MKIDITVRNIRIIDRDMPLLEKNDKYLYLNRFMLQWLPSNSNPRCSYHELYLLQANPLRVFISKVQISLFYIYIHLFFYFQWVDIFISNKMRYLLPRYFLKLRYLFCWIKSCISILDRDISIKTNISIKNTDIYILIDIPLFNFM